MTTTHTTPAIERPGKYVRDVGIVLLHDHFDEQHLESVVEQMRTLGAPIVRAIWSEGYGVWFAAEGCHRLRAAQRLGLMPLIAEIDDDDVISEDTGYDLQDAMVADDLIDANRDNVELRFSR